MEERRYYGLDALRGSMMLLGIVVHSAMLYMTVAPGDLPVITDPQRWYGMDVVTYLVHSFRMPVFFVLAGFFACLLVEKRGLWGAYRNRGARVLGPFVAALLTIVPLTLFFFAHFAVAAVYGAHELLPPLDEFKRLAADSKAAGVPQDIFIGHLWFLYYLLFFYLLLPVCRVLGEASARAGAVEPLAALPFLGLCTAATLLPYPGAQVFGEFLFLTPHPPTLLYYGSFFVLGYVLRYQPEFLRALKATVSWAGIAGLALFVVAFHLAQRVYAGAADLQVAAALASAFCTWSFIYFFIGCAMRFFDRASPWTLYASQSSYWVYLFHLPVVALFGWLLIPYNLHALAKFTIVTGATAVVCFATYHYGVQRTWIGAFLNGRRFDLDWPWRRTSAATLAAKA